MSQADFIRVSHLEDRVRFLEEAVGSIIARLQKLENGQKMALARAGKTVSRETEPNVLIAG